MGKVKIIEVPCHMEFTSKFWTTWSSFILVHRNIYLMQQLSFPQLEPKAFLGSSLNYPQLESYPNLNQNFEPDNTLLEKGKITRGNP